MKKRLTLLTTVTAFLAASGVAHAQDSFGKPLDVSFAVERPFGFYWASANIDPPGPGNFDVSGNGFSLGWSQDGHYSGVQVPRFAVDVFVIESLSVGGSIGFMSRHLENEDGDNIDDRDGFLFAPRVGYFIDFSDHFGFWPRGGFTYYSMNDPDQSQFLLTLEGYFTFAPREGFGFLFGPTIDFGFSGETDMFAPDNSDYTERSLGIMIGMFGWI
jgi:hypothetical protein